MSEKLEEITVEKEDFKERFLDFLKKFKTPTDEYKYRNKVREMCLEGEISLHIDFNDLIEYDRELASKLVDNPEKYLELASQALADLVQIENPRYFSKVKRFYARMINPPEDIIIPLRKLKAQYIGKLIAIEGIVTRISPIKYLLKNAVFIDRTTGLIVKVPQDRGFVQPQEGSIETSETKSMGIRRRDYELIPEESDFIEWQKVVIQERPEELPPGQIPRSIEAVLVEDLVDIIRPGDRVKILGILKVRHERTLRKDRPPLFSAYIDVNSIEVEGKEFFEVELTPDDVKKILQLASREDIEELIVKSIAPSIYGYDIIKKGIACLLFGGEPKVFPDGVRVRGDINILLVGDPGTAKSQLLRYIASLAPRAIYTTGKGSTAAGLTAAVVRDKTTGEFYLEAGALVLADGGVACIDEFDKMDPRDRVSIHEAMEQQTVSIAKAGIVARLNARAAILAAANPAYGRYLPNRTIAENIDLPVTILSRFDLIFVITDVPEEERDSRLAQHLVRMHSKAFERVYPEYIPLDLLKKYIAYAKKYIHPKLSPEAEERLVRFYVEMRKRGEDPNAPVTITPRQLEALIRLAEANAKMKLSDTVTVKDVEVAIELMMYYLKNVGMDMETKRIDIDIVMTGKPKSQREKFIRLMELIRKLEEENKGKPIKIDVLYERAEKEGLDRVFIEKALDHLKREGEIYEPRSGYIKKT